MSAGLFLAHYETKASHDWLPGLKWGDGLVWILAFCLVCTLGFKFWLPQGQAQRVLIRKGGEIFLQVTLPAQRNVPIAGALGESIIIIDRYKVKVAKDPGPRQICVLQGWLENPGDVAICLPNQISVEIIGNARVYDSLNY